MKLLNIPPDAKMSSSHYLIEPAAHSELQYRTRPGHLTPREGMYNFIANSMTTALCHNVSIEKEEVSLAKSEVPKSLLAFAKDMFDRPNVYCGPTFGMITDNNDNNATVMSYYAKSMKELHKYLELFLVPEIAYDVYLVSLIEFQRPKNSGKPFDRALDHWFKGNGGLHLRYAAKKRR